MEIKLKFCGYKNVIYEDLMSAYFGILGLSVIANRFAIILILQIFVPHFAEIPSAVELF